MLILSLNVLQRHFEQNKYNLVCWNKFKISKFPSEQTEWNKNSFQINILLHGLNTFGQKESVKICIFQSSMLQSSRCDTRQPLNLHYCRLFKIQVQEINVSVNDYCQSFNRFTNSVLKCKRFHKRTRSLCEQVKYAYWI